MREREKKRYTERDRERKHIYIGTGYRAMVSKNQGKKTEIQRQRNRYIIYIIDIKYCTLAKFKNLSLLG